MTGAQNVGDGCRIGVVVLDFNQAQITRRCLISLASGSVVPDAVVLVENGVPTHLTGTDSSCPLPLTVLAPGSNLGCAGGRNLGIDHLITHTAVNCIVVLDNDTIVPADFCETLRAAPPAAGDVLAPLIYWYRTEALWSSGGAVLNDGSIEQHVALLSKESEEVDWVPGACMILARETWQTVGPFDAWLNFLFEDIEWCLRVRRRGGVVRVTAALRIDHDAHQTWGGAEGPVRTWFWTRNGTVFRAELGVDRRALMDWFACELRDLGRDLSSFRLAHVAMRVAGLGSGLIETARRKRAKAAAQRLVASVE